MTKDWVHGVGHSPVCQILLQIVMRVVIISSPPAWTSSAGMLSTPADFPFINDCTAASTSFQRIGWSSSVSVWGQFSTDGSPFALWLYSSMQYSVHRFSISRSSVRHFPQRSWTVVAFLCFTVVKSFMSWYTLELLFFLRFSSISLHCSPVQFSFAFFMHLLMLLFTSLYFLDPSGSNRFCLSSFLLSHRSRISAVTQVFFFWRCLLRIWLAVSDTAVLKAVIIESRSVSSLFMMMRGANYPPIIAWKVSNTLGSFSFSRSNLSLLCFGLLILFRRRWKVIISSRGHFQCLLLEKFVF